MNWNACPWSSCTFEMLACVFMSELDIHYLLVEWCSCLNANVILQFVICWNEFPVKRSPCSTYVFSRHHRDDTLDASVEGGPGTVNHWKSIAHKNRTRDVEELQLLSLTRDHPSQYECVKTLNGKFVAPWWILFGLTSKSCKKSFHVVTLNDV